MRLSHEQQAEGEDAGAHQGGEDQKSNCEVKAVDGVAV
jgi:hypothetical protein